VRDDIHDVIFRNQIRTMQEALSHRERLRAGRASDGNSHSYTAQDRNINSGRVRARTVEMLDADRALDKLYEDQQQRRETLPFKTHLQSEGFERLLDLQ
jgi:hypothetical protein